MKYIIIALALCFTFHSVDAHEVRSAYLSIEEEENNHYQLFWKLPLNNGIRLPIEPVFPDLCHDASFSSNHITANSGLIRWTIQCTKSLHGEKISISGLEQTLIDTIVRIQFQNGMAQTHRLLPERPSITIPKKESKLSIAIPISNLVSNISYQALTIFYSYCPVDAD